MKLPALKEIVEERKDKAIETLSDTYAKNKLPLEEYERLVEYINKIESERELVVVEKIVAEYNESEAPGEKVYEDYSEDNYPQQWHNQGGNFTVLSSRVVSGPIASGSQYTSILGSQEIKVRKGDLAGRRTSVNVVSILGSTVIYVEPGVRVVNNVLPVLGSSEVNQKVFKFANPGGPELVITGTALLGDISVKLLKD